LYLAGFIFSKILFLAGLVLNWVLILNSEIVDNPAVQIGWKIARDIANLGFVLLIIIIAFGTILRNESFQAKKALPKLIIAALLINFSILIATMALDFAGVFMNFFLHNAYVSSSNGGISQAILGAMSPPLLLPPSINAGDTLLSFSTGTVHFIANLMFIVMMTAISAITMIALAVMFLIRYITIGILLILMPGAILVWAFGSGLWNQWLSAFLKQTFFGPAAAFFIYVALKSAETYRNMGGLESSAVQGDLSGTLISIAGSSGSMIMMVALFLGGLMAAEKMSIMGAKGGMESAQGILKFIGRTIPSKLGGGAFRAGRYAAGKAGDKIGKEITESKRPWLQKLTKTYKTAQRTAGVVGAGIKEVYEAGGTSSARSIIGAGMDEMMSGVKGYKARNIDVVIKKEEKKEKKEKESVKNINLMKEGLKDFNKNLETINSNIFKEEKAASPNQNKIKSLNEDAETMKDKIKGAKKNIEKAEQGPDKNIEEFKERLEKVEKKAEKSK
jgi:hypothetical protein